MQYLISSILIKVVLILTIKFILAIVRKIKPKILSVMSYLQHSYYEINYIIYKYKHVIDETIKC